MELKGLPGKQRGLCKVLSGTLPEIALEGQPCEWQRTKKKKIKPLLRIKYLSFPFSWNKNGFLEVNDWGSKILVNSHGHLLPGLGSRGNFSYFLSSHWNSVYWGVGRPGSQFEQSTGFQEKSYFIKGITEISRVVSFNDNPGNNQIHLLCTIPNAFTYIFSFQSLQQLEEVD